MLQFSTEGDLTIPNIHFRVDLGGVNVNEKTIRLKYREEGNKLRMMCIVANNIDRKYIPKGCGYEADQ